MIRKCLLGFLFASMMFETAAAPSRPPTDGLVLWLDAADASTISLDERQRVLRWRDKSGQHHDVTADHASASAWSGYVTNALNGRAVVRLNGTAAFSAKALRTAKGPVTLLIVSRRLPEQAGGKAWQRLFSSRPQLADNDNVAPNVGISVQQTSAYRTPHCLPRNQATCRSALLAVGRNVVGTSEILRGDIAEVLAYNRPLATQAERQAAF